MSRNELLRTIATIIADRNPQDVGFAVQELTASDQTLADAVDLAQEQKVGPLLLRSLQDAPIERYILEPLVQERNLAAVHFALAARAQLQVQDALSRHGIRTIWLKGIVLAQTIYRSPEQRPMVDIDVLVPYEGREIALAAVQGIGYGFETTQLLDGTEGIKHHYFLERAGSPVVLELHSRLIGHLDRILTVEEQRWFWHHREESTLESGHVMPTLTPEAHLLYLCGHAIMQHGEADFRLLRFYDLDRLITLNPGFSWGQLLEGAVHLRWTYAVQRGLELAQEYFGTSLPEGLLEALVEQRPSDEVIEHALRRTTNGTVSEAVLHNLAAMGWTDRIRVIRRIIAPPPDYMRWRYGVEGTMGLPLAYYRRMRRIIQDAAFSARRKVREHNE